MDRFHNLTELLTINHAAHAYFDDLPQYVREMIASRGDNVYSAEELHAYAEKLLRGDD